MKNSQKFLSEQNIVPFLSLARRTQDNKTVGTGPHEVKMLEDAKGKRTNPRTNQIEEGIWYLMEENGQKAKYFVPFFDKENQPHYLLQRLGTVPEGTSIILEYVRKEGSMRGYIDVRIDSANIKESDIPVIDSEESIPDESYKDEGNSTIPIPF